MHLLKPYIGGEDLNSSALEGPRRYVLDVDGLTSQQISKYPQIYDFLERRVRGDLLKRREIKEDTIEWWHFRRPSLELRKALGSHSRILVTSRVSDTAAFTFVRGDAIANSDVICFRFETLHAFSVMQSRPHELWARLFASSMKNDLRYTPSDCFETFPLPPDFQSLVALEAVGRAYFDCRASLMVARNEGMTKTYNRFHDPTETAEDIERLRELHATLDRAGLEAYGWHDLAARAAPVFLNETNEDDHTYQGRLFWPSDFREEVLARLLALNAERHAEEVRLGIAPEMEGRARDDDEAEEEVEV
jgi:hypothetical protein